MKYKGKLYGKIGGKYIPLEMHSEEVDKMQENLSLAIDVLDYCKRESSWTAPPTACGRIEKRITSFEDTISS